MDFKFTDAVEKTDNNIILSRKDFDRLLFYVESLEANKQAMQKKIETTMDDYIQCLKHLENMRIVNACFENKLKETDKKLENVVTEQRFDYVDDVAVKGFRCVELNMKWNYIDNEGNLLSKEWFKAVSPFYDDYASVWREDGKEYNLNLQGQLCDLKTKEVLKEKE